MSDSLIERLEATGLSSAEAPRKAALFADTARALSARAQWKWFVPGRIEVLGKHTDYAGGRSLLCAVERGFCISAVPRTDATLHVTDVRNSVEATFVVSEDQPAETHWRNYVATVARRIARNFPGALRGVSGTLRGVSGALPGVPGALPGVPGSLPGVPDALRGAEVAFASDLPRSAGLSSSTALIIGIFAVLSEANALERHPAYIANVPNREALAAYLGCIENGATFGTLVGDSGVGTKGGSQDHTAVLCSEAGRLVGHAYVPARRERVVSMPAGHIFAVASSGVASEKTGDARDAYNRAATAAAALVELWQDNVSVRDGGTLYEIVTGRGGAAGTAGAAGAAAPDWFDAAIVTELREIVARVRHPNFSAEALTARLDQFVLETFQIIPAAVDALARGDLAAFGGLVDRSQAAAELWLGNQIPETIALARLARLEGAAAASAFGAGFGGSVWALVEASGADAFLDVWRSRYAASFPERAGRAEFFLTAAGPALFRV